MNERNDMNQCKEMETTGVFCGNEPWNLRIYGTFRA